MANGTFKKRRKEIARKAKQKRNLCGAWNEGAQKQNPEERKDPSLNFPRGPTILCTPVPYGFLWALMIQAIQREYPSAAWTIGLRN